MEQEDEFEPTFKTSPDELPKIHKKCNHNRPHTRLLIQKYNIYYYLVYHTIEVKNP